MMRMMTDKNTFVLTDDDRRFIKTARKILANEKVQQMKQYTQHGDVSTYEHCLMVCLYAYMYAKRLKMKINIEALVRGALLHDYFLYDWHVPSSEHGLHGFTHAARALKNAKIDFKINKKEENMILSHMFPLNLTLPKSRESVILCVSDKVCALYETIHGIIKRV